MFKDTLTVGKLVDGLFGLSLFKVLQIQVLLAPQSAFSNTPKIFFRTRSIQLEKHLFYKCKTVLKLMLWSKIRFLMILTVV